MRFVIYGHFEADGIDDALWKLSQHFLTVLKDDPEIDPLGPHQMDVRPSHPGEVVMFRAD